MTNMAGINKSQKLILAIMCWLACSQALVAAEVYRVATTDISYPTKTIAIQFMQMVYKDLGHDLQIVEYPQARALIESNAGHVDGELFRIADINKEYQNLIQIPVPISFSLILAYVNKGSQLKPERWSDLKGLHIGYLVGAKVVEQKLAGLHATGVHTPEQLFFMLKNNRVDIAIYVASRRLVPNDIIALTPALSRIPVYHYLHSKNQALVAPLQKSIKKLTRQGELERLILAHTNFERVPYGH